MSAIREATPDDIPEVLAIDNQVMATSTAIYREEPATLEAHQEWFRTRTALGYPVLVATDTAVAHFREVGFTFGRWLDLMFLQRLLGDDWPA